MGQTCHRFFFFQYLMVFTFGLKGSNLNTTCFIGFKLTLLSCFPIAEYIPADLVNPPENGTDMADQQRKQFGVKFSEHA